MSEGKNYDDVIMGRRSIRGYKPDPIPLDVMKEIVTLAPLFLQLPAVAPPHRLR